MASKVAIGSRKPVLRPPLGWRKSIPLAIKLQVVVNQGGKAPDGTPLDAITIGIHFDHRPPLHERIYDPDLDETVPAANDIRFIIALPVPAHRALSARDLTRMSKTERQRAAEEKFQKCVSTRVTGQKRKVSSTIFSRPFRSPK